MYQFVGEVMTDMRIMKEMRPLGIPKGMKNAISISTAFSLTFSSEVKI